MQWEVTLRQLGKYTRKALFRKSLLYKFTQHVFLFQEIINQINFDVRESLRNDGRIWVPAKLEGCTGDSRWEEKNQQNYLKKIEIII
jgi:hypothetical protein